MSKRLAGLAAESSATGAAYRAVGQYLATVAHYAHRIRDASEAEVEDVHQLRVFTRRTVAALRVFEKFLPEKSVRKLKRRLAGLRRSAGDARDLDVMILDLEKLTQEVTDVESYTLEVLSERSTNERVTAYEKLRKALAELEEKGFWRWCEKQFGDFPKQPSKQTLGQLAKHSLRDDVSELYRRERRAHEHQEDFEELHRVRIAGKGFRYALELFEGCFEPTDQEKLYAPVKKMQDYLGAVNDDHTFLIRFERLAEQIDQKKRKERTDEDKRFKRGLTRLIERYRQRLEDDAKAFDEYWALEMGDQYRQVFRQIVERRGTNGVKHPAREKSSPKQRAGRPREVLS
ncbi:CHAD domain protein [Planctomycetes bacterium Pan216]|uniref:CHAD domain protein n=1 Tax=Kolteria novifilia TaxID=2527975 RepID=A0A518B2B1_9BACT|nr:CHAD domain protein [Planctomycetes bacterium Pan216]